MNQDESQWADAMRDMAKQAQLRPLFDEALALFGDRLTDMYFDGADTVRLSVSDLQEADTAACLAAAGRLGIDETAVQIDMSDPAALDAWDRLRAELDELILLRPRVLHASPSTGQRFCHPPFRIHLTADAETTAEQLHRNYGKFVSLHVGALPYPPSTAHHTLLERRDATMTADPAELRTTLDGPLQIRRGQTVDHHMHLTNLSDRTVQIRTNGHITTTIVDPATDTTVGGHSGYEAMPLVIFTTAPGETVRIPLLVGTASLQPELGFTVPAGTWGLVAPLELADGRHLTSAPMEVIITD